MNLLFMALLFILSPVVAHATEELVFADGFEQRSSDRAFWNWEQASGSPQLSSSYRRGGASSAEMNCATSNDIFYSSIYPGLTDGTPTEIATGYYCVSFLFEPGSISTNGITDLFGFDTTGSLHSNGEGLVEVAAVGNYALRVRGFCESSNYSMPLDDGQWHRYCLHLSSEPGANPDVAYLYVDKDFGIPGAHVARCDGTISGGRPNAINANCTEGVTAITAKRYMDDVVVAASFGVPHVVLTRGAATEVVNTMHEASVYATSGAVLRGDCSANTALECVNGTYTEPGNGLDIDAAGTHAVKLDDFNDCVSYKLDNPFLMNSPDASSPIRLLLQSYALEQNANNQVEMFYNTDSSRTLYGLCNSTDSDTGSGVMNWHNSLRRHTWSITANSQNQAPLAYRDVTDIVIGFKKQVGGGNWRLEAGQVQLVYSTGPPMMSISRDNSGGGMIRVASSSGTPLTSSHIENLVVGFKKKKGMGNWRLEAMRPQVVYSTGQ